MIYYSMRDCKDLFSVLELMMLDRTEAFGNGIISVFETAYTV